MHNGKLIAAAAITALLAACSGGGQTSSPLPQQSGTTPLSADRNELSLVTAFTARNNTTGETVHIYPTRETFAAFTQLRPNTGRTVQSGTPLLYNGGPIQTAPKMYVVFWGSSWNGSGDPDGVASRMKAFFGAIGGSPWLNTVAQYTQSNGQHVGNSGSIFSTSNSYVDTTSSPPNRPTQSQMAAEAARAAAKFQDYSANAAYVVALPHGIRPSGFGTQYCAYHSSTTASNGSTIAWTNDPYFPDAGSSCGADSVNSSSNGGILDGVTIVSGHEQAETETDPFPNTGWLDSSGSEIGDKCAWTNLIDNPAASNYPTQPLWSNAAGGCVQSS